MDKPARKGNHESNDIHRQQKTNRGGASRLSFVPSCALGSTHWQFALQDEDRCRRLGRMDKGWFGTLVGASDEEDVLPLL